MKLLTMLQILLEWQDLYIFYIIREEYPEFSEFCLKNNTFPDHLCPIFPEDSTTRSMKEETTWGTSFMYLGGINKWRHF